jgi:CBS domain-containing protein
MLVDQLMTRDVFSCHAGDRLSDVARLFHDHDCGCVPVVQEGLGVIGMVTDRDICLAAYAQNRPLRDIEVSSAMSRRVFTCNAADPVTTAEEIMRRKQVRRLPVVDESNRLVGLLSIDDIARAVGKKTSRGAVTREEVADTLAAICERPVVATAKN